MQDKLYVNKDFYWYNTNLDEFLVQLRELTDPLEEFIITLGFRGGGWDDDIWCDWKGVNIWGWRHKTPEELLAEAEAQQAKEERKLADAEKMRINRIRNRAKELQQTQTDLTTQLAEAQTELAAYEKENPNV